MTEKIKKDKNIKLIMSKIKSPKTIDYLCRLIGEKPPTTRQLIAKIRKHHPIYAFPNGDGYKFASKKEAMKLIAFEEKIINNHKKNLQVLKDYVGGK
ncbi:MAG: hypothetical protein IJ790_00740 [Lachnospiraceae bacterium]|nr:hypothetical protein [Lachnospiraceae bacterium]